MIEVMDRHVYCMSMADLPTAYRAFGQKMGIHNMIYGKGNRY